MLGERPVEHIGQRRLVQNAAQAGSDGDPDDRQVLRRAGVRGLVRPQAAHLRERAVDGPEDLAEEDLVGRPGQRVPAGRPPTAGHEPAAAKVRDDRLEELAGQALLADQDVHGDGGGMRVVAGGGARVRSAAARVNSARTA